MSTKEVVMTEEWNESDDFHKRLDHTSAQDLMRLHAPYLPD